MTNILFICKHNRFRSKLAEAYFNKINKNKKLKTRGAGIIRGPRGLNLKQVKVAKQMGINMKGNPHSLTIKLLRWSDIQVITADNVPISLFHNTRKLGKRLIVWKVPDAHSDKPEEIRRTIKMIKVKVNALVEELKDSK